MGGKCWLLGRLKNLCDYRSMSFSMKSTNSFSLGGCLFLAIGLFLNNYQLIRGGLFIIGILVLLLTHTILTKHQKFKERINEEIDSK